MLKAKTLVHKAAIPIAINSIRTFAEASQGNYNLEIHSDGSLSPSEFLELTQAAGDLKIKYVEPADRFATLAGVSRNFPKAAALLMRSGYMAKLQVLADCQEPSLYFDSDIIWLKTFMPIIPPNNSATFSTETWSWYFGILQPYQWIKEKVPRRINSGFTYLSPPFPFERLEWILETELYTPDHRFSTDQELLAILFKEAQLFSPNDFARSRVGLRYELNSFPSVALHFPGGMWRPHLDDIRAFSVDSGRAPKSISYDNPEALTWSELARMHLALFCQDNRILRQIANLYRKIRSQKRTNLP